MQELEDKIRRMMLDAEEEVPSRVWDAVSAGLDKAARGRVVPLWRRLALSGVAAAAAVAVGVFLAVPRGGSDVQPRFDKVISQAVPSLLEPALTPARDIRPADRRLALSDGAEDVSEKEVLEGQQNTTVSEADVRPDAVPASTDAAGDARDTAGSDAAALNALAFAQRPNYRDRFALSAGGNLQTNGNPSSRTNRYMRAPAQPQTGIQEGEVLHYGIPVSFGLGFRYRFAPKFSVGTGLVYTGLNRSFSGRYIEIDGGKEVRSFAGDIVNAQHYLGVPLNLFWHMADTRDLRCYAFMGGMVERCLSDSYRIPSADNFVWSKSPKGVQLSASLGLGVEFGLTDHLGIYIDPSLHYWFNCHQSKSIRTQQPLMMGLEAGIRFGW